MRRHFNQPADHAFFAYDKCDGQQKYPNKSDSQEKHPEKPDGDADNGQKHPNKEKDLDLEKIVMDSVLVKQFSDGVHEGFHEAAAEAVRFLVDVQGYRPGDGLCLKLASHLRKHGEQVAQAAFHRPRSVSSRVEERVMQKSARALTTTKVPLEKLRLLCLCRGPSGIMGMARVFRRISDNDGEQMTLDQFFTGIKETDLELNFSDAEELFKKFDKDGTGAIGVNDFIKQLRPPMSESRISIVEQAFKKLDKSGDGVVSVDHIREMYSCDSDTRYETGEDSADLIVTKFLANFEIEGSVDGQVTFEEFLNYYSGISFSIDDDCYFDLLMRQAYKL